MSAITPITVPLVNPNEHESQLVHLAVKEGQSVKKGDLLAVFETTKAAFDLLSEADGFILGISIDEGDLVNAGHLFCYLSSDARAQTPHLEEKPAEPVDPALPSNLRITRPALEYARNHNIDFAELPAGMLITEEMLKTRSSSTTNEMDPKRLVIYGGGGHAKALIDLVRAEGKYEVHAILDDNLPAGSKVMDVTVLGGGAKLGDLRAAGIGMAVNAVGGIGNIQPRLQVFERLRNAGFIFPTVCHPRAWIEPGASIADGCQLFFNAYVGSEVLIGFGCIVNTGAIISHDCRLEDYVNISPGAILAGAVNVHKRTLIGMGVTINLNVTIGAGARIGNSAVIKTDVPENGVVRAGNVWPVEPSGYKSTI